MPEQTEVSPSLAIGHYLVVLRRRWRVVFVLLVVGLIAAVAYLQFVNRQSTATTMVNVRVISTAPFDAARSDADLLDSATEQQIASSSSVADIASESLDGVTGRERRAGLEGTLMTDATVMRISYTGGSPAAARAGADAIADAYLTYRTDRADERKEGNVENLTDQLDDLRGELRKANRKLDNATVGTSQYTQAESDRQLVSMEIDSIVSQIVQIQQIDTDSGTVLTSAADNAVTTTPRRALILATGVLGGLALGLVAAFVVNTLDRRVRDQSDVEGAGGGRILSRLTSGSATVPATGSDLDALRVARERLLSASGTRRVIAIIDGTRGPTPSDVPVNLAVVLTETSPRVEAILPECPTEYVSALEDLLELKSLRDDERGETLGARQLTGLDVYLPHPDKAAIDDDTTGVVRSVVGAQRDPDQFTVIALPPSASAANRLAAARMADVVIMVIEEQTTRIDDIAQVVAEAREVGARVVGVIVVPSGRTTDFGGDQAE
ncbi:MAG: hypothetical protein L0K86_10435 [Actinomycetia bacterium]|nr:hypothetical protein [Actinomycetes bacterium]